MMLSFRKVSSIEAHNKLVAFLTQDVFQHGGSASEVVDMHGHLWDICVCKVPWGTLLFKQETTALEAWAKLFEAD